MTSLIVIAVVFLVLSGLMAAIDAAVLSVTRPEIEELVQQDRWGAKRLREVKARLTQTVVVVVVVTNTINVLGPILVSHRAFALLSGEGVIMVTVALTMGTIVFSEILPKALGAHLAPQIARVSAPALMLGRRVLAPLVLPLAWLSNRLTRGRRDIGTERQICSLVRIGHSAGLIESGEEQLIHRVFFLNDRKAADIMTPLEAVRAVAASSTVSQAAAEVSRTEFSRYPVLGDAVDNVRGIALSRDLLHAMVRDEGDQNVMSLSISPLVVDADTRSDKLLDLFRDCHVHMAVVQRANRTIGIVTLEDVLEQLVGEIDDEKDVS